MDTWKKKRKGKDEKSKRKTKKKKWQGEREKREREREGNFFFSLHSKIYGNRTVGFRQRKRQSRSMHRELHVGTKILEFRQTPRGREISYLGYF